MEKIYLYLHTKAIHDHCVPPTREDTSGGRQQAGWAMTHLKFHLTKEEQLILLLQFSKSLVMPIHTIASPCRVQVLFFLGLDHQLAH